MVCFRRRMVEAPSASDWAPAATRSACGSVAHLTYRITNRLASDIKAEYKKSFQAAFCWPLLR